MTDNLKKFLELVSKDEALQAKLNEKPDQGAQTAIELAAELGITLTHADFEEDTPAEGTINDDELEAVAGGGTGGCGCAGAGGGGGKDDATGKTFGCACVGYGEGGIGKMGNANCRCCLAGAGTSDENR